MAWYEQIGNSVLQAVRSLASWIGLDTLTDELSTMTKGMSIQDYITRSDNYAANIQTLINKISNKYNIESSKLLNKISDLSGIPVSSITKRAVSKEKKKIEKRLEDVNQEFDRNMHQMNIAGAMNSSQMLKNASQRVMPGSEKIDQGISKIIKNMEVKLK